MNTEVTFAFISSPERFDLVIDQCSNRLKNQSCVCIVDKREKQKYEKRYPLPQNLCLVWVEKLSGYSWPDFQLMIPYLLRETVSPNSFVIYTEIDQILNFSMESLEELLLQTASRHAICCTRQYIIEEFIDVKLLKKTPAWDTSVIVFNMERFNFVKQLFFSKYLNLLRYRIDGRVVFDEKHQSSGEQFIDSIFLGNTKISGIDVFPLDYTWNCIPWQRIKCGLEPYPEWAAVLHFSKSSWEKDSMFISRRKSLPPL